MRIVISEINDKYSKSTFCATLRCKDVREHGGSIWSIRLS